MNLQTSYLGLPLRSPLVASASPLSEKVANIRRLEDAGAGAVVLYSLFEEQLRQERLALYYHLEEHTDSHAEASSYFPEPWEFRTDAEGYLEHIRAAKESVDIPIIASLNGTGEGNWVNFAKKIEQAGADALELNLYSVVTDPEISSAEIEQNDVRVISAVCSAVNIPVAVKISPYFTSMGNMAKQFVAAGARGLVMFNRFYQPDIDLETLEVHPNIILSSQHETRLPLRWIAILYGRLPVDFAATSGVHHGEDAVKLLLAGANVTMMASALLRNGIEHLQTVERELLTWMEMYEYESVGQMRGALSQINCPQPAAFERAQYMRALTNYPA